MFHFNLFYKECTIFPLCSKSQSKVPVQYRHQQEVLFEAEMLTVAVRAAELTLIMKAMFISI